MVYDDLDELEPEEEATNEYGCPISQKEWDALVTERDALRALLRVCRDSVHPDTAAVIDALI